MTLGRRVNAYRVAAAALASFCYVRSAEAQNPPSVHPPWSGSAPPPPPPDPEPAPAPAPSPAAETAPAPAPAPAAPAAEEASSGVTGNIRLDVDYWGPQLAVTANHPLSGAFQYTHTIGWMPASSPARDGSQLGSALTYNAGINLTVGPLVVSPQLGFSWDASGQNTQSMSLSPQLYLTYDRGKAYAELWLWYAFNEMFAPGVQDWFYLRALAMYRVSSRVAVGPEIEFDMPTTPSGGNNPRLKRMPMGVVTQVDIGAHMNLLLFAAYDVAHANDNEGITGRLSWWYSW